MQAEHLTDVPDKEPDKDKKQKLESQAAINVSLAKATDLLISKGWFTENVKYPEDKSWYKYDKIFPDNPIEIIYSIENGEESYGIQYVGLIYQTYKEGVIDTEYANVTIYKSSTTDPQNFKENIIQMYRLEGNFQNGQPSNTKMYKLKEGKVDPEDFEEEIIKPEERIRRAREINALTDILWHAQD